MNNCRNIHRSVSVLHQQCLNLSTTKVLNNGISKLLNYNIPKTDEPICKINRQNYEKLKEKYLASLWEAKAGGGEKGIKRHVERNKKMLVRDRINLLLDKNSEVLEISPTAGLNMKYDNVPSAGCVSIVGKIHGFWCMVIASDATVKSGSIYPITLKKQLRAEQIAFENKLPTVHLVDSGGAFLPLQSEIFTLGGRVFYRQAVMSASGIPQIAVVCGSCTAGAAYIPAMADEAVILDKIGTIFLGGPPLVYAATGERVTAEQLGGAALHCKVSGVTDHFAETEESALTTARDIIATLNLEETLEPSSYENPMYDIKLLNDLTSSTSNGHKFDPRTSIACIVDGSRFHEFKEQYGSILVTGFGRVKGHLAGFLANQGRLTGPDALKGTHFVQLCSQRNIPLVFLQNFQSEQPPVNAQEDNESFFDFTIASLVKSNAQLMQAVACANVPSVTLTTGGLTGSLESHALGSLSMGSRFHFVYPNALVGGYDPDQLSEAVANAQCDRSDTERSNIVRQNLLEKFTHETDAFVSANRMYNDGIILPEQTRDVLATCLSLFRQEANAYRRYPAQPMQTNFRM